MNDYVWGLITGAGIIILALVAINLWVEFDIWRRGGVITARPGKNFKPYIPEDQGR